MGEYPAIRIRIPEVDRLMTEANAKHIKMVCINNTEEDKKYLKNLDKKVIEDLNYVNSIVKEVLQYLESRGCDVSKYI